MHHLSVLQKDGLKIWVTLCHQTFQSNIYLLFTYIQPLTNQISSIGMDLWDTVVRINADYIVVLEVDMKIHNHTITLHFSYLIIYVKQQIIWISPQQHFHLPGDQEYSANLLRLILSPNQWQFELHWSETGIIKALLILGLTLSQSLGVPLCMIPDIMHLAVNITNLLISLWHVLITCSPTDDITTWDWTLLCDKAIWQAHECAVEETGQYIPSSFNTKPQNIAEKINTNYKT